MSVFAIASDSIDVYDLADELALRGWHLDRQHFPPSLHVTVNYVHAQVAAEFLSDLETAVGVVNRPGLRKTATKFLVKAANLLPRRQRPPHPRPPSKRIAKQQNGEAANAPSPFHLTWTSCCSRSSTASPPAAYMP